MALTRRQRQVLDVVRELIEKNGYSPSLEEIGAELDLSSVATVHKHVSHLVQKGYLRRTWNQNRSIELVESREPAVAIEIPVEGRIAPGEPLEGPADAESVAVPRTMVFDEATAYALRARGNGLQAEQIRDGDLLVLERRSELAAGQRVLLVARSGAVTLRLLEAGIPRPVAAGEMQIAGVLVGVIRKY
jgi:repressor LexA